MPDPDASRQGAGGGVEMNQASEQRLEMAGGRLCEEQS